MNLHDLTSDILKNIPPADIMDPANIVVYVVKYLASRGLIIQEGYAEVK